MPICPYILHVRRRHKCQDDTGTETGGRAKDRHAQSQVCRAVRLLSCKLQDRAKERFKHEGSMQYFGYFTSTFTTAEEAAGPKEIAGL